MKEKKEYWVTNSRFKLIAIFFAFMWLGILLLFYLKADEVTKNPCSICADKLGNEVTCTLSGSGMPITKVFNADGSSYIVDNKSFSLDAKTDYSKKQIIRGSQYTPVGTKINPNAIMCTYKELAEYK